MPSCETRRSSFRTAVGILADHRRLHAVVKDFLRRPADCFERRHVTAQDGLQVLVDDEARPDQPREAEHQREQPHDAGDARLVAKLDFEVGEIDLRLRARRRLKADLERLDGLGPNLADGAFDRGVAAAIASLPQLPPQPHGGEAGIGCKPLAQIRQKGIGAPLLRRPRAVGRRLQAACDGAADRLAVHAKLAGDRRDGQSLPVKFQDHHEFPEFDHRAAPSRQGEKHRRRFAPADIPGHAPAGHEKRVIP